MSVAEFRYKSWRYKVFAQRWKKPSHSLIPFAESIQKHPPTCVSEAAASQQRVTSKKKKKNNGWMSISVCGEYISFVALTERMKAFREIRGNVLHFLFPAPRRRNLPEETACSRSQCTLKTEEGASIIRCNWSLWADRTAGPCLCKQGSSRKGSA